MIEFFYALHPVLQALFAGIFTWGVTAIGAAMVFLAREINERILDSMLGFAGGVMIAASFWSLLAPAIELSQEGPVPAWMPAATGFIIGGIFLQSLDLILPHLHKKGPHEQAMGPKTGLPRTTLLVLAITIHNIPEGLAVGVAFGAVAAGYPSASIAGAVALALGIGIQNFPEGLAVSVPLHGEGLSRMRSFWYGQLSGVVEPMAALVGAATVYIARFLLPYALAFAAGAMIFVVVDNLIPEWHLHENRSLAMMGLFIGFACMMVLDVAFG
jgi:ZIP family zinc transporter